MIQESVMPSAINEEILVSVIIPTYNRAGMIGRAIDSVLRQTFERYEIIVIDDGSMDDTQRVVEQGYPQVQFIRKENGGASSARNRGLVVAKGELVAFLDADDVWFEDKLEKQVALMTSDENVPLCFTDWRPVRDGKVLHESGIRSGRGFRPGGDYAYHDMINGFNVLPSCTMVRKELLFKYGLFNETLSLCEDWDLFLKISTEGPIAYIDIPMLDRHLGEDNLTTKTETWMRSSTKIIEEHLEMIANGRLEVVDKEAALKNLSRRLLVDGNRLAYILYTSGKGAEARSVLVRCIRVAGGITMDIARLLVKTFIPHTIGRRIKHVVLGK
jgi:glycosyltransferase involved in cell wall biosynthesis